MRNCIFYTGIFFWFLTFSSLWAQEINYDLVIPPANTRPLTFEDYLVQQAWHNHPDRQVIETQASIADEKIKLSKKDWVESFQVSASMTPRDTATTNLFLPIDRIQPGTVYPPVFNIGIGWNIGSLFSQKNKVRISSQEAKVSHLQVDREKLRVRKEVLTTYKKLEMEIEVYKARKAAEEDAKSSFTLIAELFKKNKATFEEYNQASMTYFDALEKRVVAENDIEVSKIELEALVGQKWYILEQAKQRFGK